MSIDRLKYFELNKLLIHSSFLSVPCALVIILPSCFSRCFQMEWLENLMLYEYPKVVLGHNGMRGTHVHTYSICPC